jgi:hypothetical protein
LRIPREERQFVRIEEHDRQARGFGRCRTWPTWADGMTVMIGGFGTAGMPMELVDALVRQARATSSS